MRRLLVDVNVILDALLPRPPHGEAAIRLWAKVERRESTGLVPAHGVTTLFYLLSRARGTAYARRAVSDLLMVFGVAAVDDGVLLRALALGFADFEDAVCAAAAEAAGCDLIVTRDPAGFKDAPMTAVDAETALAFLDRTGGSGRVADRAPAAYAVARRKHGRRRGPGARATAGRPPGKA